MLLVYFSPNLTANNLATCLASPIAIGALTGLSPFGTLKLHELYSPFKAHIKNIVHLADSAIIEDDNNNKHSSELKDWSVEKPNAPYLNRYVAF